MQKHHKLITVLLIGYLVAIVMFMLARNMAMTPDRVFVILLFGAVIVGRGKTFLKDWVPFIALLLGYELIRGFADSTGFRIHVSELVNGELALFGFIPTVALQQAFFNPENIRIWDIGAVIIDFLHFPLPLIVAFYFWIKDKKYYWRFVIALLVLSFSAFLTYLLYPAAPPWYASQKADLISVHKIVDFVVADVGWGWDFSRIYNNLNPNQVAAMPSLHSAYPWLAFLALRAFNKRVGWFFLPYPILVWLSVVYLGEHYVIDVLAGIAFATGAYLVVYHFAKIKALVRRLRREIRVEDDEAPVVVEKVKVRK